MLTLEPAEQVWLDEYRHALRTRHPGVVARLVIYGSKARGDAHADSDVDVLLVVRDDAGHLKVPLREIGYDLAAEGNAVPSIFAYTQQEWDDLKRRGFPFQCTVEREGVSVL